MQGAMSEYIQVHNDREGRVAEFSRDRKSGAGVLKALAWNSTARNSNSAQSVSPQLGNVGQRKGTSGYVDLVVARAVASPSCSPKMLWTAIW